MTQRQYYYFQKNRDLEIFLDEENKYQEKIMRSIQDHDEYLDIIISGETLKHGDFLPAYSCTHLQFEELMKIEGDFDRGYLSMGGCVMGGKSYSSYSGYCMLHGLFYVKDGTYWAHNPKTVETGVLLPHEDFERIRALTFNKFRSLAINTFKSNNETISQ